MINQYLLDAKNWYENRDQRERCLIFALALAFWYAFFSFFFFNSHDNQEKILHAEIRDVNYQINSWTLQINHLNQIAKSPIYAKWAQQQQSISAVKGQYQFLLHALSQKQWQDIVKVILQSYPNVKVVQIKNFPETLYVPLTSNTENKSAEATSIQVYQQKMILIVYSNYPDTVKYLQQLEQALPNIHWDRLSYQVVQYPLARIEMEFSIIYEKNI